MNAKPIDCVLDKMAPEAVAHAAEMLKQLAHPMRLRMVDLLHTTGELPVSEITDYLGIAQATTSQHLNQMRRVGLLKSERRGKAVWYSIADARPISLLNCICNCCENPVSVDERNVNNTQPEMA
ncbi:MAG: metalloregulator ArsR/SmtB family transcription factor [Verrucomicrobiota bacterium]|nr:metalloregulator ArsR/SmtB family transcription factor [Verrucomicrobiota bacterium]